MVAQAKATLPLQQELSQSFQRLTESASRLNKASDDLSKEIGPIEAVLKKLNLGIPKWYAFEDFPPDAMDGSYFSREIGYAKIGGKWCLALGERSGNVHGSDPDDFDSWPFTDAPRQLRIRAVKAIPKLLEALVEEADKVTAELKAETARAHEVAQTLTTLANTIAGRR